MNNLIERLENLLQTLDGDDWEHPITCQEDLRKAIDLLKWRPISDEPDKPGYYLCKCVNSIVTRIIQCEFISSDKWSLPCTYVYLNDVGSDFMLDPWYKSKWKITHWRPLPEPSEGDEG
jgi:hypothetical protein